MKIREYIKEHTLLFDGSMGTYFAEKHRDYEGMCETANIRQMQNFL